MRRRSLVLGAAGAVAAAAAGVLVKRQVDRRRLAALPGAGTPSTPTDVRRAAAERQGAALAAALLGDLALPEDVRHLEVTARDGGVIHLVETGAPDAPPIVLLHGVTLQAAVWAYQLRDLSAGHRVIALDLRGHGTSEPGEAGCSIAAIADDLADVLTALDLKQATVAGHSMGGMATLRFLRRSPEVAAERVGAIGIVASAGGVAPEIEGLRRLTATVTAVAAAGQRRLGSGRPIMPGRAVGEWAAALGFGANPDPTEVRAAMELTRSMSAEHFIAYLPELAGFNERAVFDDPGVPVSVTVGDRDRLTPPRLAKAVAASLPGSRLYVWPGAGHMLMYERRGALCAVLDRLSAEATR